MTDAVWISIPITVTFLWSSGSIRDSFEEYIAAVVQGLLVSCVTSALLYGANVGGGARASDPALWMLSAVMVVAMLLTVLVKWRKR